MDDGNPGWRATAQHSGNNDILRGSVKAFSVTGGLQPLGVPGDCNSKPRP